MKFNFILNNKKDSISKLNGKGGVYVVYHNEKCLYVGCSEKDLSTRVSKFFRNKKCFINDNFYLKAVMIALFKLKNPRITVHVKTYDNLSKEDLFKTENLFIKKFKPILNYECI